MVDREHVAGTEAAPEKVDQESQGGPPEDSASEESYDDEKSPSQAGDAKVSIVEILKTAKKVRI